MIRGGIRIERPIRHVSVHVMNWTNLRTLRTAYGTSGIPVYTVICIEKLRLQSINNNRSVM